MKKRYVRGNDLVFMDEGNGTEKQYYVTDPHGSVVQLTDENGKVTRTYEYDSFGKEGKPDKKDENPFRYCGEYYDKETEEVYLRARYYQPKKGRFLTRDTYTGEEDEPGSLHLYVYCGNDGVNSIDPSGHKKKAIILIGSDVESSDNGFIDNANTWKYKHRNYDCKQYLCWKSDSLEELFQKIVKKNKKRKANRLLIMGKRSIVGI